MRALIKLGKHGEGRGDSLDRISSLPDELLGQILSFLPTRCAVKTSVLSSRWRYLFTLTNCLSFDDAPCFGDLNVKVETQAARFGRFKAFVCKVLELHQVSPIQKFSLVCRGFCGETDLSAWVSNAIQKGVRELHLDICDGPELYVLPDSLFICETLVNLKLIGGSGDYELEVPLSTWMPNLKILHLEFVRFLDHDSVKSLFSSCAFLEELTLQYCICDSGGCVNISCGLLKVLTIEDCSFQDGLFEIDAPNLAYLTYGSSDNVKIAHSWKNSRSLVKAELSFNYCHELNHDSYQYDRGLIKAAACKATNLSLLSDSVEILLTLAEHEEVPDYHNLSILRLGYCPHYAWKNVTSLLDKSPQLETVIFEWGLHRCYFDPESPPDVDLTPFSCHVKEIIVRDFCGHECSMLLLGHLLRNAGVLKRLIVKKCSYVNMEEVPRITKELLMLPRASGDCHIEFG